MNSGITMFSYIHTWVMCVTSHGCTAHSASQGTQRVGNFAKNKERLAGIAGTKKSLHPVGDPERINRTGGGEPNCAVHSNTSL